MEYGIDWDGPNGHHQEGVTVPEVQLPRPLTEVEVQRLLIHGVLFQMCYMCTVRQLPY